MNGVRQIAVGLLIEIQRAIPEGLIFAAATTSGDNDWQRGLAFTEVIADGFPNHGGGAAIVECIVDDLEGQSEVLAD